MHMYIYTFIYIFLYGGGDACLCMCVSMRIHECVFGVSQVSHDGARPTRSRLKPILVTGRKEMRKLPTAHTSEA